MNFLNSDIKSYTKDNVNYELYVKNRRIGWYSIEHLIGKPPVWVGHTIRGEEIELKSKSEVIDWIVNNDAFNRLAENEER